MIALTVAAWVAGGLVFAHGFLTNSTASPAVPANSRALIGDLLRLRSAAGVALILFITVWPAVFIGAHLSKVVGSR